MSYRVVEMLQVCACECPSKTQFAYLSLNHIISWLIWYLCLQRLSFPVAHVHGRNTSGVHVNVFQKTQFACTPILEPHDFIVDLVIMHTTVDLRNSIHLKLIPYSYQHKDLLLHEEVSLPAWAISLKQWEYASKTRVCVHWPIGSYT